jgi:hypothetical protein
MTSVKKTITCGGLFAGIGGFCLGFEKAGFKTLWGTDLSKIPKELIQNSDIVMNNGLLIPLKNSLYFRQYIGSVDLHNWIKKQRFVSRC